MNFVTAGATFNTSMANQLTNTHASIQFVEPTTDTHTHTTGNFLSGDVLLAMNVININTE